jgi:hypothetical protein
VGAARKSGLVAVACLALVAAAAADGSSGDHVRTSFVWEEVGGAQGPHYFEATVIGHVSSPKRPCIHRKVSLYFVRDGKRHLRDRGASSRNGEVALKARARATPEHFLIRVLRKRIRHARHPYTCRATQRRISARFPGGGPPPPPD